MKKFLLAIPAGLLIMFFTGCSTSQVAYQSKIDINPTEQPNQYYMKVKLIKSYYDDQVEIFTAPVMIVYKNQPATIEAGDIVLMKCVVTVLDEGGQTKAKADVNINNTDDGTIWQFTQTLLVQPQLVKTAKDSSISTDTTKTK